MNKISEAVLTSELVMRKIYEIRGMKVMLDSDLVEIYGVETKRLREAVKRNANRLPKDFMFQLSEQEWPILRSQFATSSFHGESRYLPFVFTEPEVATLSGVLNSDRAIAVNIHIMRVYTKMREFLLTNKDLLLKLNELEDKVGGQG